MWMKPITRTDREFTLLSFFFFFLFSSLVRSLFAFNPQGGRNKRRKKKEEEKTINPQFPRMLDDRHYYCYRTTGSPASKSPAGSSAGPASSSAGASASVVAPGSASNVGASAEPRTPTTGPQNKQLQNVKGDHPSVK